MNIIEGLFLGVLQGITEWLPISSSGQSMLVLINILKIPPDEAFSISIALHLGSLFAVLYYFRGELLGISKNRELLISLIIATIISGIVGLPLYFGVKRFVSGISGEAVTMLIGLMLIITGLILRSRKPITKKELNPINAAITGAAQGAAVLPGISRSGTTIAALLLQEIEQETALRFSFLLAIPAILGLFFFESMNSGIVFHPPVMAGIVSSFIMSLATMHYFIKIAKDVDFSKFVIIVGVIAFTLPLALTAF